MRVPRGAVPTSAGTKQCVKSFLLLNLLGRGWRRRKARVGLPQPEVSCHGDGIGWSLLIHACGIAVGWEYSGAPGVLVRAAEGYLATPAGVMVPPSCGRRRWPVRTGIRLNVPPARIDLRFLPSMRASVETYVVSSFG